MKMKTLKIENSIILKINWYFFDNPWGSHSQLEKENFPKLHIFSYSKATEKR